MEAWRRGWIAGEIAVAAIRGNKQGVIVFSRAQAVTADMVSWCVNGAQA